MHAYADGLLRRKLPLRRLVLNELHSAHQPLAADVTHVRMIRQLAAEVCQQPLALFFRLVGETLPLEDLYRPQRDRTADRMTAVRMGVHPHGLSRVQDLG